MQRLLLTSSSGERLGRSGFADFVVPLPFLFLRFVWGRLPSPNELATYLAARSDKHGPAEHWSDFVGRPWRGRVSEDCRDLGLLEFCEPYDIIELWFSAEPNDQLQQIWLLDYFRAYPEIVDRLRVRLVDFDLDKVERGEEIEEDDVPVDDVTAAELETASRMWQAYRATTPEACFELLHRDLSAFPLLRPALADLLEELPSSRTGLGATEMRLLELVARGYSNAAALIYHRSRGPVFKDWEIGLLLEGLAHGPRPAVEGLDDELRVLPKQHSEPRLAAFRRSQLSLTEFGEAILAHKADFSRHNPIDRWWGGTRLTNDNLWRWNPALIKP